VLTDFILRSVKRRYKENAENIIITGIFVVVYREGGLYRQVPLLELKPAIEPMPALETIPSREPIPVAQPIPGLEPIPESETIPASESQKHNRSERVAVLGPYEALPYYIHTCESLPVSEKNGALQQTQDSENFLIGTAQQ
jgi:hypothetical protein